MIRYIAYFQTEDAATEFSRAFHVVSRRGLGRLAFRSLRKKLLAPGKSWFEVHYLLPTTDRAVFASLRHMGKGVELLTVRRWSEQDEIQTEVNTDYFGADSQVLRYALACLIRRISHPAIRLDSFYYAMQRHFAETEGLVVIPGSPQFVEYLESHDLGYLNLHSFD